MPGDGYDKDRKDFDSNARGRIWENGTDKVFRDQENGYTKPPQSREYWTPFGYRRYDKEKINDKGVVRGIEDKSGEVGGRKDRDQFRKDRFLLERGVVDQVMLRTVENEPMSPETRQLAEELVRDFPGRYVWQEVARNQAREVWAQGLQVEKGMRVELPGVGELVQKAADKTRAAQKERTQQAKDLALAQTLDKSKSLSTEKANLSKTVADKGQELAQAQDSSKRIDATDAQQAHKAAKEKLEQIRAQEQAQTRAMLWSIGVTGEAAKVMEQILARNLESQRAETVKAVEAIGKVAEREAQAQLARDQAKEFQDQQKAKFIELGYSPEFVKTMELVNRGRPAPGVPLPGAPELAPEVTRDGRAAELQRTRNLGLEKGGR